jgi:ribosomal protein S18 acetylase RimI-like enzyme
MKENNAEKQEINFEIKQTFGGEKDIADLIAIEESVVVNLKSNNNEKIYSAATTRGEWQKEFQNPNVRIFFIEVLGRRVGSLMFEEKDSGETMYISGVAMMPEYQGKGIVKKALMQKLEEFKSKNYKRIYLLTHPENPARKLYESLGFYDTEKIVKNYDGIEPRIIMDLKI